MISLLMSKKEHTIEKLDAHIKIFLSTCHRFCDEYYDSSIAEFWFTKCNFILLLNLPEHTRKFGHLGLYWDGTFERFIQGPTDVFKSARKTGASL